MNTSESPTCDAAESGGDLGDATAVLAPIGPASAYDRLTWQQQQERYWGEISASYDNLYQSRWSLFENAWVTQQLGFVKNLVSPVVVDLGCGTGLGCQLLREINPTVRYIGVDISTAMAQRAAAVGDHNDVIVGAMDDLSALDDASADVVIALFSSVSFAYRTSAVLAQIGRVLRPGGHAYLSALSATSISRTTRRAVREGVYRTRGDRRGGAGVPVRLVTIAGMRRLIAGAGLTTVSIAGMNAMSGTVEIPQLWRVGRLIARLVPAAAHTIEIHLRKLGSS